MSKNRSRSPSGDHSESTILKISNHAGASEAGIRAFFKGLEVDVSTTHQILNHNHLVCLSTRGWCLSCQVCESQGSQRSDGFRWQNFKWERSLTQEISCWHSHERRASREGSPDSQRSALEGDGGGPYSILRGLQLHAWVTQVAGQWRRQEVWSRCLFVLIVNWCWACF